MSVEGVDFGKGSGLVPCVTQDARTGEVLMLAYMNAEALQATLESGYLHYWSRSRGELWRKGETSGHTQRLVSLHADCDGDALLARVVQEGPACHTGERNCFHNALDGAGGAALPTLAALDAVVQARAADPGEGSWTARLLADENLRLKKVAEEAAEVVMAAKDRDPVALSAELADLIYHALVAGRAEGVGLERVLAELARRRGEPTPE